MNINVDDKFGRWTVTAFRNVMDNGRARRLVGVKCECGTEKTVRDDKLLSGRSRSCGCLRREVARQTGLANRGKVRKPRHNLGPHYLHPTWRGILARCENPENPDYLNYGGRGITLYPAWHDFAVFVRELEAEIGPRPAETYLSGYPKYTLDRADNDRGYEPGNVRWATAFGQFRNRRTLRRRSA